MNKVLARTPPVGAPEGTVWFGGPVDRWKVSLRLFGEDLDPDRISALLGCEPTSAARRDDPFPKKGRWILQIDSRDCGENDDVDEGVKMLLSRVPSDPDLWAALARTYSVNVYCGIFIATANRGFGISAEVSKLLSDRGLEIRFDLYYDPQE